MEPYSWMNGIFSLSPQGVLRDRFGPYLVLIPQPLVQEFLRLAERVRELEGQVLTAGERHRLDRIALDEQGRLRLENRRLRGELRAALGLVKDLDAQLDEEMGSLKRTL